METVTPAHKQSAVEGVNRENASGYAGMTDVRQTVTLRSFQRFAGDTFEQGIDLAE